MQKLENKQVYEFGEFRLDTGERLLLHDKKIVPLTTKEFEVLLALVERAGEIVKKDALLDRIWADVYVEEGTLMRNISWLRKKLAIAAANSETFIETVPKRGYRFLSVVNEVAENSPVVVENFAEQNPAQPQNGDGAPLTDVKLPAAASENGAPELKV